MARDVLIFIGGSSFGVIITLAVIMNWPGLVFLKRGDQ